MFNFIELTAVENDGEQFYICVNINCIKAILPERNKIILSHKALYSYEITEESMEKLLGTLKLGGYTLGEEYCQTCKGCCDE